MDRPVTGYGALPTQPQPHQDTEPEPFGPSPDRADTAKRCAWCGHDAAQTFSLVDLRRWLVGQVGAMQALHVTEKFRRWISGG